MTTINQIRDTAGTTIFERGLKLMQQDCFDNFQQRIINDQLHLNSTVIGTYPYQVTLVLSHEDVLANSCTCPAAEYQHICKHAVAVWLEYIDRQNGVDEEDDDDSVASSPKTTARKPSGRAQELKHIRQWLEQSSREQLIEQLYDLAESSSTLRDDLSIRASLALSVTTAPSLNKYITKALPRRELWGYEDASDYFSHAYTQLQPIVEHLVELPALEALAWCLKALKRISTVDEYGDYADDFGAPLITLINSAIAQHYQRLEWPVEKRCAWLLERTLDNEGFPNIEELHLSDSEQALFYAAVQQEFDHIEVPRDHRQRQYNQRLQNLYRLLTSASAPALTDRQHIALKEKITHSASDYCNLATHWLDMEDELEAEDCLIRARSYSDIPVHVSIRIQELQERIDLLSGKADKVWRERWADFQKQPSFRAWSSLSTLLEEHHLEQHVPSDWLEISERLLCKLTNSRPVSHLNTPHPNTDITLFYLANQQYAKALDWVEGHSVGAETLIHVVKAGDLHRTYPDRVQKLAYQALDSCIKQTNKQAYAQAAEWLQHIHDVWGDDSKAGFPILVQQLQQQHRRKPNFMVALKQALPAYME